MAFFTASTALPTMAVDRGAYYAVYTLLIPELYPMFDFAILWRYQKQMIMVLQIEQKMTKTL